MFRPIDEHLMPKPAFVDLKEDDKLGIGVQSDGAAWLPQMAQMMDFNLRQLAWRARYGKLEGVRIENGTLIVTPRVSDVPAAADALNDEIGGMYPLVEVPDLRREVHEWTDFADQFTTSGREMRRKTSPPCWPACSPMAPTSARTHGRSLERHQRQSDRLDAEFPCPVRNL